MMQAQQWATSWLQNVHLVGPSLVNGGQEPPLFGDEKAVLRQGVGRGRLC